VTKWQVEKIKTIGDAYMCASGLPDQNEFHPVLITLAALEIRDYMDDLKAERLAQGVPIWELRLGIHSGPLIAGVVGKKKFAYDIWGDTVNTAARLESSSEAGKVNISGTTHNYIDHYFECTQRGKIEAKNKGKIDMYFVDRIKAKYAEDAEGKVPSEEFIELLGVNNKRPTHKLF
jgi:adenylate cyclase